MLKDCARALELDTSVPGVYTTRARVWLGHGKPKEAIDETTKALKLDKDNAEALFVRQSMGRRRMW